MIEMGFRKGHVSRFTRKVQEVFGKKDNKEIKTLNDISADEVQNSAYLSNLANLASSNAGSSITSPSGQITQNQQLFNTLSGGGGGTGSVHGSITGGGGGGSVQGQQQQQQYAQSVVSGHTTVIYQPQGGGGSLSGSETGRINQQQQQQLLQQQQQAQMQAAQAQAQAQGQQVVIQQPKRRISQGSSHSQKSFQLGVTQLQSAQGFHVSFNKKATNLEEFQKHYKKLKLHCIDHIKVDGMYSYFVNRFAFLFSFFFAFIWRF